MIKLIFKNLWMRRRKNIWLMLELVLVTFVSWLILDPIIVMSHDKMIPLGYEPNGLYEITLNILKPGMKGYEASASDHDRMVDDFFRLVDKVRSHPDVESATPLLERGSPNSGWYRKLKLKALGDSLKQTSEICYRFMPNSSYFTTFSFAEAIPYDTVKFAANDILLTEDMHHKLFAISGGIASNECVSISHGDTTLLNVMGVIGGVKHSSIGRQHPIAFIPIMSVRPSHLRSDITIVFRTKKGINSTVFLEEFYPWMVDNLRIGNLYSRSFRPFSDRSAEYHIEQLSEYRYNKLLAIFFLINLFLGVVGTFWIQTKSRKHEIGIMLSYGASPYHILRQLWGEGLILTTISVFVGCLIYLQYVWKEGLYEVDVRFSGIKEYWVTHFDTHFIGVSFIVYAIILLVVLIGIFIPGYRISHIKPTEALRDE